MHHIMEIHASGLPYRELNQQLQHAAMAGFPVIQIRGLSGQRYIGTGLKKAVDLHLYGTPGSDLAAFGHDSRITVYGNAQEAVGNTMHSGEIIIHGNANDVLGISMQGGRIFVRGNTGYRTGIHMKSGRDPGSSPVIVIGGTAQDYLGEYMAGGTILVLGLGETGPLAGDYLAAGMHGGVIYLRGTISPSQLGAEVSVQPITEEDRLVIGELTEDYCRHFGGNSRSITAAHFTKLVPKSQSPYGVLYTY